jgi:hypothetical protein
VVDEAGAASQVNAGGGSGPIIINFTPLLQQAQRPAQAPSPAAAGEPAPPPSRQGLDLVAAACWAAGGAALLALLGLLGWRVRQARRRMQVAHRSRSRLGRLPAAWPSFKGAFMDFSAIVAASQQYEAVGTEADGRGDSIGSVGGAQRPASPAWASPPAADLLEAGGGGTAGVVVELQARGGGGLGGGKAGANKPAGAGATCVPAGGDGAGPPQGAATTAASLAAAAPTPQRGSGLAQLRPAAGAAGAPSPAAPAALQRRGSVPQLGGGEEEDWLGAAGRLPSASPLLGPPLAAAGAGAAAGGGAGRRSSTRIAPL